MPFEKGNTLSTGRPKKERSFAAALNIEVKQASKEGDGTKLRDIAATLVQEAIDGNVQAIKEVADRLDGKAQQAISVAPESGAGLAYFDITGLKNLTDDELSAFEALVLKAGNGDVETAMETSKQHSHH